MTLIGHPYHSSQNELAKLQQQVASLKQQLRKARRAERRSRTDVENYRKILDALPHAVFLQSADGQVLYGNQPFYDLCDSSDQSSDQSLAVDAETIQWLETINFAQGEGDRYGIAKVGTVMCPFGTCTTTEAIRNQEVFLDSIYRGTEHLIFIVNVEADGDFHLAGWNNATERATGIASETIIGKTPEEVFGSVDGAKVRQYYRQCVQATDSTRYEECLTFQGQKTWWLTTLNPLKDESGRVYRLIGTTFDITSLKQTEETLRYSESKNRALVSALPDLIMRMTGDGIYLDFFAATAFKSHGNPSLVGKDISNNFPSELAKLRLYYMRQALETSTLQIYEQEIFVSDERRIEEVRIVVCGPDEVLVIVRDITDRKLIEEELRRTNEQLERRVEDRTLLLQQTVANLKKEISDRKQAELKLQSLNTELEQRTTQLTDALTQLKKSQQQLIQTEKMSSLGQLVAGVAHEINNPVNFIHGNLSHATDYALDLLRLIELYQQYYPQPPAAIADEIETIDLEFLTDDLTKLLQSMRMGTDRIREIVRSLRNFSRLDEAEVKDVDVHEGIDSTLTILCSRLKAQTECPEIKVVKEYGQLPLVKCYPGQLNQVFMNILSNAIDALEEANVSRTYQEIKENPSQITIRTNIVDSTWVKISISDNGIGMTESVYKRIFDPFFTTKEVGKGTGMGMSISYQIVVEKHGGKLDCRSTVGKGTQFIIQIPVYQKAYDAD